MPSPSGQDGGDVGGASPAEGDRRSSAMANSWSPRAARRGPSSTSFGAGRASSAAAPVMSVSATTSLDTGHDDQQPPVIDAQPELLIKQPDRHRILCRAESHDSRLALPWRGVLPR